MDTQYYQTLNLLYFYRCNIIGAAIGAYDASYDKQNNEPVNNGFTRFYDCKFLEESNLLGPPIVLNHNSTDYSYLCSLHDPFDPGNGNWPLYECVQQDFLSPYIDCSVPGNAPLIDFEVDLTNPYPAGCGHVYFRGCTIESNLQMTLAKFNGGNQFYNR